jgi:hypothetical protein
MSNARLLPFVISGLLAGCTTPPATNHTATAANAAGADRQCHTEQLTGSLISRTVCTTKAQRDAEQAALDQYKSDIQRASSNWTPPAP